MSKYLPIIFLSFISLHLIGQYIPIVDTENNWISLRYDNFDYPNVTSGYLIKIEKDTIVDNIDYKKVCQYELNGTHPCPLELMPCFIPDYPYKAKQGKKLLGFIRESISNKKIYYRPIEEDKCSEDEYEIYDFSLQQGDSLSACQSNQIGINQIETLGIVDSITTESNFNLQRRTLHITGITSYIGLHVIGDVIISEGIGFIDYGLIYGLSDLDVLIDFCSDSNSNCDITLSKNNFIEAKPFTIYPNPTNDLLHINSDVEIKNVYIYSINGILLNSYQSTTNIDVSHLERGYYLIRTKYNNNQFDNKSFIKY